MLEVKGCFHVFPGSRSFKCHGVLSCYGSPREGDLGIKLRAQTWKRHRAPRTSGEPTDLAGLEAYSPLDFPGV